ncbi:hypothetical protein D3C80_761490 [compost metagenome]
MQEIKIEIKNRSGKVRSCTCKIASTWNELDPDVYPYIASVYLSPYKEKMHTAVSLFTLLLCKHHQVVNYLPATDVHSMLFVTDFLFEKLDLTTNLIPVVKAGGKEYHGPKDELENLTFIEWCFADSYFERYVFLKKQEQQDPANEYLDKFLAVLYRPKKQSYDPLAIDHDGDIRVRFNENLIKERAKDMNYLPCHIRDGIVLWYMSCRQKIENDHPHIFPQKKKISGSEPDFGWMGVFDELTGDKFGGQDELARTNLFTVLFSMERNQIKFKKYKNEAY